MAQTILIIEDDQPILEMMDLMIRKLGYEPVLVTNGIEALEQLQTLRPALILLDIMMMPINGWEFLAKLRSEPSMNEIPVLIFSASPAVEEKMAQLNDNYLGVLHKPVTFVELREGIGRALQGSSPGTGRGL